MHAVCLVILARMTAFYDEATPGKVLDFYRMLRPSGGVDWWSDEDVEVE